MRIKKWPDIYLRLYEAKTTACLYFAAFTFFYLFYGVIDPSKSKSIDFWTALQLYAACLMIGFGQVLIQPKKLLTVPRILLWGVWSAFVTVGFVEGFHWFTGYPAWYRFVFYSIIAVSFVFLWLTLYWQLQKETKTLNDALKEFKEKNKEGVI
jgi:hypothetical protein